MVETMRCVLTATSILHSPAPLKGKDGRNVRNGVEPGKKEGWEEVCFNFVFFLIILLCY